MRKLLTADITRVATKIMPWILLAASYVLFVVMIVVLMFSNSFFQNVFSDSSPGGGGGIALIIFGPFVAAIAVISIVGFLVALCANISTNSKKEKENTIESNQETKEENNN